MSTKAPRAADSWYAWDLPVLLAIAEWDEANVARQLLTLEQLTERMGRPAGDRERIGMAVNRLMEAGFVEAKYEGRGVPWSFFIFRLTPSGLQACGAWPGSEDLAEVVIRALESQASALEAKDPDGASKVRAFARYCRDAGMDVAKAVVTAVITHQIQG